MLSIRQTPVTLTNGGYFMKNNDSSLKKTSGGDNVGFTIEQFLKIIDNIPLCINVLDENADSVYCNAYTVDLYGLKAKQDYIELFYDLTCEIQPDGKNSKLAFSEHVLTALEKGEDHFNWLDIKLNGEELPLFISIYKLNTQNEKGQELLVSTMRDMRPQLAGFEQHEKFNDYYYNQITYKELFTTVAELTEEWFWIYDVNMATIQFFGKGREILGLAAEKMPFPSYVVDSGMVYPKDLDAFLVFDNNLKKGVVSPVEVRFVLPSGVHRYYRITYKTVYDKSGKAIFSIGKTYDIDRQKRLEVMSKTDLLTNCLNKITTENIVKDVINIEREASHALFIIDIDDFKSVNDKLGHYFGDIVLCDIAKNLHANFRGADIIGRIGGDEFLVFVKNISDEKVIKSKAASVALAFQNTYAGENKDYKISGSIGVSLYPKHAKTYEDLYKCADKALYSSKMAGKDRYTVYSQNMSDLNTKTLTLVDNANKTLAMNYDNELATVVFEIMYEATNTEKALNTVMRVLVTHLNASRSYVAQTFDLGASYSITHEWATNDDYVKKEIFQNVDVGNLKTFFGELEDSGMMHSNNATIEKMGNLIEMTDSNNTFSYLLVQTKSKGHARLILGIEDSNKNRVWSEKEMNTIQYIVKMVSIFLASSNK